MSEYWKQQYAELQVQEILDSKFKNLSPAAKQALAPALLAEQLNQPDNPHRRKERQGVHYNFEDHQTAPVQPEGYPYG
jgi:hypothetical protein